MTDPRNIRLNEMDAVAVDISNKISKPVAEVVRLCIKFGGPNVLEIFAPVVRSATIKHLAKHKAMLKNGAKMPKGKK